METIAYISVIAVFIRLPSSSLGFIPTVHVGTSLFSGYIWGSYSPDLPGLQSNPQVFKGISYAKLPRRWEDPEYDDPRNYFIYRAWYQKSMCPQGCSGPSFLCVTDPKESEDCLYMDIWAPEDAAYDSSSPSGKKGLPVMVFLHGGNFKSGSGLIQLYTPAVIVERGDVIVAVINYRHGAMGFLATGNGNKDLRGNYGIKDQRMAMYWIHKNIKYFGGNPNKVTLFGQSAGCQSIALHMINKKSDLYFQQAILQSCPFTIPYKTYHEAERQARIVATSLSCPVNDTDVMITCLKSKPTMEIVRGQLLFSESNASVSSKYLVNCFQEWGPVIDNNEVPMNLMELSTGVSSKPAIVGFTRDEAILYIYSSFPEMTYNDVLEIISAMNIKTKGIEKRYPLYVNNSDARAPFSDIATDYIFRCPTFEFAAKLTGNRYVYEIDTGISIDQVWEGVTECYGKACHGVDLGFVFQTGPLGGFQYTDAEMKLSNEVIDYWTRFVTKGRPGKSPGSPKWKYFSKRIMVFQQPRNQFGSSHRPAPCKFWTKKGYTNY